MLDHLHDEPDPRRRRLIALGLLTRQLAPHGIEPILVGGGALASCGTARGDTKEVASIRGTPASMSRSMNSIFRAVGMKPRSAWKPSRGPTSVISACSG